MTRSGIRVALLATMSWLLATGVAGAGSVCPPPPNPNFPSCPLAVNRAILTEEDIDGGTPGSPADNLPDNIGSTGSFCGSGSPATCPGFPEETEVSFGLIVPRPDLQDVTCSAPFDVHVWIMGNDCESCLASGTGSATLPKESTGSSSLRVVISEGNQPVCVCGPEVTCEYSVEAVCDDGSDGDGDGLIDEDDPDCCIDSDTDGMCGADDCNDGDTFVWSPPAEVKNLRLSKTDAGTTRLAWDSQDGTTGSGTEYDVLSGDLTDLVATGGFGSATCMTEDDGDSPHTDHRPDPDQGVGYFYLVRAQNSCEETFYGDSSLTIDPRDDLESSNPCSYDGGCPGCTATCAGAAPTQQFSNGMVGCGGNEFYSGRGNLCGVGSVVCIAEQWVDDRGAVLPAFNYWTDDYLGQGGADSSDCYAAQEEFTCAADRPMRVCNDFFDPLFNTCEWLGCGLDNRQPNESFGGCAPSDDTAGTLCCVP